VHDGVSTPPSAASSIVGYQTKAIDEHYNWTCNMFKNVDGSDVTLEDLKVDDSKFISTTVEFFDKDGAVNTINDPNVGDGVCEQYFYLPANYAACGEAGWYLIDDNMGNYNRKSRVIGAGEGFVVNTASGEAGAVITLPSALK